MIMKDEMENQQTREMKRQNLSIEICPGIARRTNRKRRAKEVNAAPQLWPEVF
jgi:hypothetical protein